jgi:predicted RecB family endonuclease
MPEAVTTFIEHGIDSAAPIHSQILQTYQTDFVKYAKKTKLNYWLHEGKEKNAEIHYVMERENNIVAIEVKAGAAGKIRVLTFNSSTISGSSFY